MKIILPVIITALIAGGTAFYGGMTYSQGKNLEANSLQAGRPNFQNLTAEQKQQIFIKDGSIGSPGLRNGSGEKIINGEIIKKDDQSITIKLADSGSKIIFFSDTTKITETIDAEINELLPDTKVMVAGSSNTDGSITAKTIQIRPELSTKKADR
jgi:hypothetical protein